MTNYSKNAKRNYVLNEIEKHLLELGVDELKRYKQEFPHEYDYNIAQYGNCLIYYYDIRNMYKKAGFTCVDKYSDNRIWELYKKQVGYVTDMLIKHNN